MNAPQNEIVHALTNDSFTISMKPILSPINEELFISAFEATEGLSRYTTCDVYEACVTWRDLADHFECEANSNELDEAVKHQRDVSVTDSRVKGMLKYLNDRTDTLFPSLIIFVNEVEVVESLPFNGMSLVKLRLPSEASRLVCDGQGRLTTIKNILGLKPELASSTIGVKFICTNTESLIDASKVIRQAFADVNGNTRKPDASLSIGFDSAKPFSRLLTELLETPIQISGVDSPIVLRKMIALNGKIKAGQLYTLKQFSASICALLGATEAQLNKECADTETYETSLVILRKFYSIVLPKFPLLTLWSAAPSEYIKQHKKMMFTRDLFLRAIGHLGRSLFEEQLTLDDADGSVNWAALDALSEIPLCTLDDPIWLKSQVCWKDDSGKQSVVKIYKGSDKKIARVLCQKTRVFPALDI